MRKSLFVLAIVSLLLISSFAFALPGDDIIIDECPENVAYNRCVTRGCTTQGAKTCSDSYLKTCVWDEECGCLTWASSLCNDNNACTSDTCSGSACVYTRLTGTSCGVNLVCQNGVCVTACVPNCAGKVCGQADGCGGCCTGGCVSPESCVNCQCQCVKNLCTLSNPTCCPNCECSIYVDDGDAISKNGRCLCDSPPPAPGPCTGGSAYMKGPASLSGCLDNACAEHLDTDSYRREKNGPNLQYINTMESSVGSPDTWRGACLARPGVTHSDEISGTWYDFCTDANHLKVYYLDGIYNGVEELESAVFACPTGYACEDDFGSGNHFCNYECSTNNDCYPVANGAGSGYYCSSGHCCLSGNYWSSVDNRCVPSDMCTTTCSLSNFWTDPDCWLALPLPYEKACCNVGYLYGYNAWYDFLAISIY